MIIPVKTKDASYDIVLQRGCIKNAGELFGGTDRKALVVTDSGVPEQYAKTVAASFPNSVVYTFPQGEQSKNFTCLESICRCMLKEGFTRSDCVIAVGGGVAGDMAGFAAAIYMRGIAFYNIPTTILSQVDSSIGGKTAVDLDSIKNIIGAFYQPKMVLIDPDVLSTLDKRQISNGLAEAVKAGVVGDESLFEIFQRDDYMNHIEKIIEKSLLFKREIVQLDEKETGVRKALNFGHTIGHGIEAASAGRLYHGECVALGMLPMCGKEIRPLVAAALKNVGLPTEHDFDPEKVFEAMTHDKKSSGNSLTVVKSDKIGSYYFEKTTAQALRPLLNGGD